MYTHCFPSFVPFAHTETAPEEEERKVRRYEAVSHPSAFDAREGEGHVNTHADGSSLHPSQTRSRGVGKNMLAKLRWQYEDGLYALAVDRVLCEFDVIEKKDLFRAM